MPTFNWVLESQPIVSEILKQPSRYKRVESNLLADNNGPQQEDPGSCLVIYKSIATLEGPDKAKKLL